MPATARPGSRQSRRPIALALGAVILLGGCSSLEALDVPGTSGTSGAASNPGTAAEPAGQGSETTDPGEASGQPATPDLPAPGSVARAALDQLPIKGRAPKTGYDREQFGQRWSDDVAVELGHNGCDTRNDVLGRDLINKAYKPNTRDCVVTSGQLADPYTGAIIDFQRGQDTSNAVQIDHVVALSDAWQKGAQQLAPEVRQDFANDPLNLLAVDGPANQQKRDGDAATWLPPSSPFRCQYVARQVAVKTKYLLWVTQAEHDAIARWLDTCAPEDDAALAALFAAVD